MKFRLVQGRGFFSSLIGWYGGAGLTHIDTVTPEGKLRGARNDWYYYQNSAGQMVAIPPGYRDRPADYLQGKIHGGIEFDLDVTPTQELVYWHWSDQQLGKPYDRRGILGLALGQRDWHADDQWFCSEAVAAGGEQAEFFPPIFEGANRVDPGDIAFMLCMLVPVAKRSQFFET
jgi:hypothetical protein